MVAQVSGDPPERPVELMGANSSSFSVWQQRFPLLFSSTVSRFGDSDTLQTLMVAHDELVWNRRSLSLIMAHRQT